MIQASDDRALIKPENRDMEDMKVNQIYSLTHTPTDTHINTPKFGRLNPQQHGAQSKALLQTKAISHLA